MHYFNEFDRGAAAWLRELIKEGHLPQGEVDERSIKDVQANDLRGFTACHFFAGIGGWPYALRLAGWPDDRPVWTGSCPCQPYSAAGKGHGDDDPRNLWPDFFRLIRECRPDTVFGEQVEGAIRHGWLDGVQADLEGEGYAVGHCVLGAHSVGAPHIRQRLYWLADAGVPTSGRNGGTVPGAETKGGGERVVNGNHSFGSGDGGESGWVADAERDRLDGGGGAGAGWWLESTDCGNARGVFHPASDGREQRRAEPSGRGVAGGCVNGGVGNSTSPGCEREAVSGVQRGEPANDGIVGRGGSIDFWGRYDLIPCRDGKSRRVEPRVSPLAHGVSGRVGLLRGYGNAIVPQVAAEFVRAFLETKSEGLK